MVFFITTAFSYCHHLHGRVFLKHSVIKNITFAKPPRITLPSPMQKLILPLILAACAPCLAADQLVTNGGFEADPAGTKIELMNPQGGASTTTFKEWRVYNVGVADELKAEIVDAASEGKVAIQLEVDNSNGLVGFGLDRDHSKLPVTPEKTYALSFDAARTEGTGGIVVFLTEYDSANNPLDQSKYVFEVTDTNFQTFSILDWTPKNPKATQVNLLFQPGTSSRSKMILDNIQFQTAD